MTSLIPSRGRHVAVIGLGAAGLVAARELRCEGHTVVGFEREKHVGGLWMYTDRVELDSLSADPDRTVVHSSVYESLRTNLPRECMGFSDFPFVTRSGEGDPRRYPDHREVLKYLQDFAKEFKIDEMVRFETEVLCVEPTEKDSRKWRVQFKSSSGVSGEETFDAVVVCNGHYTEPRIAHIPGIDSWPGKQFHSHNYRIPDQFKDQVVIVIGGQASGNDISSDIASMAKEVHISAKGVTSESYSGYNNLRLHPPIYRARKDGSVVFKNGKVVFADAIVHCTGYKYHFPFLKTNGYVTVEDNRVGPLYKHVFPPALAPGISFIGLPFMGLQFFMFEIQSKWVASVLSGRAKLPSEDKMMEEAIAFYAKLEDLGIPKRYTHFLTDPQGNPMLGKFKPEDEVVISQRDYFNWIAEQCGCASIEPWRERLYNVAIKKVFFGGDCYRDRWDADQLIKEVYGEFAKLKSNQDCSS